MWWQWAAEEGGRGPGPRSPILPRAPSAGRGRGRRLPAPGLQGADHGVQRLERGLFLQPEPLPGHQPELQPLQQLGHDHLHLHLSGGAGGGQAVSERRHRGHCVPSPPPRAALRGTRRRRAVTSAAWASYLRKLLPDAGAGAQREGEVGEPRPAGKKASGGGRPVTGRAGVRTHRKQQLPLPSSGPALPPSAPLAPSRGAVIIRTSHEEPWLRGATCPRSQVPYSSGRPCVQFCAVWGWTQGPVPGAGLAGTASALQHIRSLGAQPGGPSAFPFLRWEHQGQKRCSHLPMGRLPSLSELWFPPPSQGARWGSQLPHIDLEGYVGSVGADSSHQRALGLPSPRQASPRAQPGDRLTWVLWGRSDLG